MTETHYEPEVPITLETQQRLDQLVKTLSEAATELADTLSVLELRAAEQLVVAAQALVDVSVKTPGAHTHFAFYANFASEKAQLSDAAAAADNISELCRRAKSLAQTCKGFPDVSKGTYSKNVGLVVTKQVSGVADGIEVLVQCAPTTVLPPGYRGDENECANDPPGPHPMPASVRQGTERSTGMEVGILGPKQVLY